MTSIHFFYGHCPAWMSLGRSCRTSAGTSKEGCWCLAPGARAGAGTAGTSLCPGLCKPEPTHLFSLVPSQPSVTLEALEALGRRRKEQSRH